MKTQQTFAKLACFILLATSLTMCKNKTIDEDVMLDIDTEIIKVDAEVEVTVAEIVNIADQAEVLGTVTKKKEDINDILGPCASVEKDTTYQGQKMTVNTTVDFGDEDCEGLDGRHRRGKIKVITVYETFPFEYVISRQLESEKYHFKKNKINLDLHYEKDTSVSMTQIKFFINGNVKLIEHSSHDSCYHEFERTVEMLEGLLTPKLLDDDVWSLGGTTSGYRKDGKNYQSDITEQLIKSSCRVFDSGKIIYSVEGEDTYEIDYGAGDSSECNTAVDITKNGEKKTVYLE